MVQHLTVRMAWHDAAWDGTICRDPSGNSYCEGTHSLLSERLSRDKDAEQEQSHKEEPLDVLMPEYLPPCYWSSNAFSANSIDVVHAHPFPELKTTKRIPDSLPANSMYTWPFRLSFNHSKTTSNRDGKYPRGLSKRIERFVGRFRPNDSLVFFYLNYDNPISADEFKYALVGCAKLKEFVTPDEFEFSKQELKKWRSGKGMQHFPAMNWALRVSYDFAGTGVRLPYHEYLAHIEANPDDEKLLSEISVLIDEDALVPGFKYVAEEINDDQCLYSLYKMRRAFESAQGHGIVNCERETTRIDDYIGEIWQKRGLYPGLASIFSFLSDLSADRDSDSDNREGRLIVEALRKTIVPGDDLCERFFHLLNEKSELSPTLAPLRVHIRKARQALNDHSTLTEVLRKLSLFSLTPFQIQRILFPDDTPLHPFGGRNITPADIARNPYLLCENYVAVTGNNVAKNDELDRDQLADLPIGYFTIDIGMLSDEDHLERSEELQNLTAASPERLRAFFIDFLVRQEQQGHCFASLEAAHDFARQHPLFYRDRLRLTKDQLLTERHQSHYSERLHVCDNNGRWFFYLRENKYAEEVVERVVSRLLDDADHRCDLSWIPEYLENEALNLASREGFDSESFVDERHELIEGFLSKRFFIVSGKPGSGKTKSLQPVISFLKSKGEEITVLAPTGKAALRVISETKHDNVHTIDRWIFKSGLSRYLDDFSQLSQMAEPQRLQPVENVVFDEASMINLRQLAIVFRALEKKGLGNVKRIILVGDENQLPPIGPGRPFFDIISHLRSVKETRERNMVRLKTNCRQEFDQTILDAAELFAGKNRYHSDLMDKLQKGGSVSKWLNVRNWSSRRELHDQIANECDEVLSETVKPLPESKDEQLNLLFGLYESGFVQGNSAETIAVDNLQIITPYRGGFYGTLGINNLIRETYKQESWPDERYTFSVFGHSDKVMRIKNLYFGRGDKRRLVLPNGAIGVICNNKGGKRRLYFAEATQTIWWSRGQEEEYDLAYAITIHKAQGSEFEHVFVVVPERRALLSKELVYTALTRSKGPLTIFVERADRENPLKVAQSRSFVFLRNTSLFSEPLDSRFILQPEEGEEVKSKIEYLIYRTLMNVRDKDGSQLHFTYEKPKLTITMWGKRTEIKPDFVIEVAGRRYFWEHLGMLDQSDYLDKWKERKQGYETEGLKDALVTTDDLNGVRQECIERVIADMMDGTLSETHDSPFSAHHYRLWD